MATCMQAIRGVVTTIFCGLALAGLAHAQAPSGGKSPLPPIKTQPATGRGADAGSDSARRAAILMSDRWRKVELEFQQWLSVQVVYTPRQVEEIKAKLAAEVQSMSPAELEQFLDQWDAKLKILLGKDADEARNWLGEYMSVMADGYRKHFLASLGLTDVTKMSAAQVEEAVDRVRMQRMSIRQQQAAFNQNREQQVQAAEKANAQARQMAQQQATAAMNRTPKFNMFQSHYSPRPQDSYIPTSRPQMYVNPYGRVGFLLPW